MRLSLRLGLLKFNEGDTVSFAYDEDSNKTLCSEDELRSFTPFAFTTKDVNPPQPFILFYDPKIKGDQIRYYLDGKERIFEEPPRGPIVIHGGFTSAFGDFSQDEKGTGRLIVSIACWIARMDVRVFAKGLLGGIRGKTVPCIKSENIQYGITHTFNEKPIEIKPRHTVMILDGSGSMENYKCDLCNAVNEYIDIQTRNKGVVSIVSFSNEGKILLQRGTVHIREKEYYLGGGTDYSKGFKEAIDLAKKTNEDEELLYIFFTDGYPNGKEDYSQYVDSIKESGKRMDVVGFGENVNRELLKDLVVKGTLSMTKTVNQLTKIFLDIAPTSI